MLRRHRFWVLGILGLVAVASLVSGIREPPSGRRDASYYFWYPGQAVSSLIIPPIADAGRLNTYAQLPVAFFVNVLLYASNRDGRGPGAAKDDGAAGREAGRRVAGGAGRPLTSAATRLFCPEMLRSLVGLTRRKSTS